MTPDEMLQRIDQLTNLVDVLCVVIVFMCAAWLAEEYVERLTGDFNQRVLGQQKPPKIEFCKLHSRPITECRNQHKLDGDGE